MTPEDKDKEQKKTAEPQAPPPPPPAADLSIVSLEAEMKRSYLDYAMSVIIGRAIPDIKDGLKPVHRRVLYAMYESGTTHSKPYKKSARIVGDVIGKYHPHGDQAAYDTLVRMAQDFSMRYVLVDGQGNFGSIDGDPPAAMRYTEVRMSKLAEEMMADIEKDTVNFVPNYDESLTMPEVLPTKFPNLLVNGGSGIAVGMATNIPPHNLGEVCNGLIYLVKHPNASLDKIMEFIPGPDFPTAGYIFNKPGIRDAYRDGRGVIQLRAKSMIERGDKGERERIVITEIPYAVNKARLLESTADLVNSKKLEGIADIRDESDREGIRVVLEVKKGELPEVVLNNLYKHTALQTSFGIIMLAIVDKQPKVLGLIDVMKYFISHRQDVIRRRTRFDLKKAELRAHILEGLVIALDHLDAIIKLIRASRTVDEARAGLMEKFKLTQIQAQAILEMQLQRLTHLERDKIVQEYKEVRALIVKLRKILGSDQLVLDIIVEELKEIKEKYGDERKTEIRDEVITDIRPEDLIKEEDVVVMTTQSGYIKRTSLSSYHFQMRPRLLAQSARDPRCRRLGPGQGHRQPSRASTGGDDDLGRRRQRLQRRQVHRHAGHERPDQEDPPQRVPERAAGRDHRHEPAAEEPAHVVAPHRREARDHHRHAAGQGHPVQREGHPADGPDGGRRSRDIPGQERRGHRDGVHR
jgi:DNA gyrase subunit A